MRQVAARRGGKCLSKKYLNNRTKLQWQCAKGHIWEAPPNTIQQGHWCPTCGGRPKLTIDDMKAIARSHRGECLSKEFINTRTKLKWKCSKGHTWKATSSGVLYSKAWCQKCGRKRITKQKLLGIEDMQRLAKKKGGKCLTKKYIDNSTKLLWQ